MANNGNNNNGDIADYVASEKFKGALIPLETLMQRDGQLTKDIQNQSKQNQGVIMTVITPPTDDNYRQVFLQANWANEEQRSRYINAFEKARKVNSKYAMDYIIDRIHANTAGDNGWLILEGLHAINHTSFTTNVPQNTQRKWIGGNRNDNSPLS